MNYFLYYKNKYGTLMQLLTIVMMLSQGINSALAAQVPNGNDPNLSEQLTKKISIDVIDTSVREIIYSIQKQSKLNIIIQDDDIDKLPKQSMTVKNETAVVILKRLLADTPYEYKASNNNSIAINKRTIVPQNTTQSKKKIDVKGTIIDEERNPLAGATVVSLSTNNGSITDEKGNFLLQIEANETIEVSFLGYKTTIHKLAATSSTSNLVITLKKEVLEIDDVIVTGIFKRKKEGFTGSALTVKKEDIVRMTSNNVLRALDMIDPGFRMGTNNLAGSNPNAIPDFQMRGQSNMGNYDGEDAVFLRGDLDTRPNQPLFVLDGIIGVSVSKIIDIDPSQIESITILKDAAAMVIYGSRASNGVVVIETRAPEKGRLRVSYNGNYKVQAPDLSVYNLLNAADKLDLELKAGFYDERPSAGSSSGILNFYTAKYLDVKRGVDTYWLSQPVQTAFQHRHGVDLEGGDNTLRYKIYFGANFAPGVMKKTGVESKNGSIDIRYRLNKLLISNQLSLDYTTGERSSPYGSFRQYGTLNAYYRLYDEQGNLRRELDNNKFSDGVNDYPISEGTGSTLNPMYNTLYSQKDRSTSYELRDIFRVEYTPIDNLRLSTDVTLTKTNEGVDAFKPSNHTSFVNSAIEDKGTYNWRKTDLFNYAINFAVNYNKTFNKHLLSLFIRYDIDERAMHSAEIKMSGFPNDTMDEVFLGAKAHNATGSESRSRSMSGLGTINYSYDQRYAIDLSGRIDASSEFGRNNRFAPFWSAGMRWNINKEKFLKQSKLVNELVVRATYGITGSQGISPYLARQMYSYKDMMKIYHSSDVIGTILSSMGNPDLKWQQTRNSNIGLDFTLLNNILSGRVEYYHKYTTNTLLDLSLAPSVGFNTIKDNMGNISNQGYEATLRIMAYNNKANRLNVNIIANGGYNQNRIVKISNALKARNEESISKVTDRPLPRYEEGYSQSIIWGVRSLGIDPITGREVFLKRNGEMTNIWDGVDQIPVGDTEPLLRGTVGANLNWGGFSFSLACRYEFGGKMYNYTLLEKVENANLRMNVDYRAYTERWTQPGDVTYFKGLTRDANGTNTKASSRFVMDNNEFAIATINVQYRFESRSNPFLKKIGLSSAALGFYFEDLGRFSTVRMERGIDYPFARQVSMSLNLVF